MHDICPDIDSSCSTVSVQYADISIPIKLHPQAVVGQLITECCGQPIVYCCHSYNTDCENESSFEITVTQTVRYKIPIEYSAQYDVGDTIVNCKTFGKCSDN